MSVLTASRIKVAPSAADSVSVSTGAGAWVNGSWTQILASTSAAAVLVGVHIWPSASGGGEIDIGVGGAGSETVLSTFRYTALDPTSDHETSYLLVVPVSGIPNGGRISARNRWSQVGSTSATVAVMYSESFDSDHVTDSPLKVVPSNSAITVTPSGTGWANSSWVQFTGSLGDPSPGLVSLAIVPEALSVDFEIDIGTGGAGSEVVVETIKSGQNQATAQSGNYRDVRMKAALLVSSGSRVAMRLRKSGTSTSDWFFLLQYHGNLTTFSPVQKVTQTFLEILIDEDADIDQPPTVGIPCTGGGTVASSSNPSSGTSITTATEPHAFVKISPVSGSGPYYYGLESINKTLPIYGRVLSMGTVKRVLCDGDHGYEASVVTTTFEDTDGVMRALGSGLKNALVEYFVADLATLTSGVTNARRYFRGYCDSWQAIADLEFSITAVDALTARLTSIDADDLLVPVKTIDSSISDQNPLERMFDKPVPEPYGSLSDEAEDEPEGVWELKHVGNITLTGDEDLGNCPHFLVSLGAVAKIQSIFGGDPLGGDEPTQRVKLPASAFGDWRTSPDAFLLVPKGTDWSNIEAADYSDKNGQRYELVIGKDGHPVIKLATEGRIPLVANFCARETTGDATGNIINNPARALLHWLNNGVLQQATGNWLSQASFGDYSILDSATFETVATRLATLSYLIAGIIGDDYTQRSWRDGVADFCRNFGLDIYGNRHGQGCLNKLDTSSTGSGATAFTETHVLDGSISVDQNLDAVENTVRYVYQKNYKTALQGLSPVEGARLYREPYDGKWGSGLQTLSDSTSISNLGGDPKGVRRSRLQEYNLVRDQATADAVAQERLDLRAPSGGRAEVSFDVWPKDGCDVELGDIVTLSHRDCPWTGSKRCQVRQIAFNFDDWTIRLTVRNVDDLLA